MLVDSHCHLDFPDLFSGLDSVLARAGQVVEDRVDLRARPPAARLAERGHRRRLRGCRRRHRHAREVHRGARPGAQE